MVLFGVPGAFTPTCSDYHLPGFVLRAEDLQAKGVDRIVCVSVNDVFVMKAWGEANDVGEKVTLVADGSAVFTKALGLEIDLTGGRPRYPLQALRGHPRGRRRHRPGGRGDASGSTSAAPTPSWPSSDPG